MLLLLTLFVATQLSAAEPAGQTDPKGVSGPEGTAKPRLEIRDGDRVVYVGDTFVERDQRTGYFETDLATRFPGTKFVFRNLGWSADTVRGLSRAYFDPPEKGRERLIEQIQTLEPTVLIVGYGMADSLEGNDDPAAFAQGYRQLLDDVAGSVRTLVLVTPIKPQSFQGKLPVNAKRLPAYVDVIRTIAKERGAVLLDFYGDAAAQYPTENGLHPIAPAYAAVADWMVAKLGLEANSPVEVSLAGGEVKQAQATTITGMATEGKSLTWKQKDQKLPLAKAPTDKPSSWKFTVSGLEAGTYQLLENGKPVASGTAEEWKQGIAVPQQVMSQQTEELRVLIDRKNGYFFHRYRPQNITYLIGFRKHEQGHNAKEIDALDGYLQKAEEQIAALSVPAERTMKFEKRETP